MEQVIARAFLIVLANPAVGVKATAHPIPTAVLLASGTVKLTLLEAALPLEVARAAVPATQIAPTVGIPSVGRLVALSVAMLG